MSTVLITGVAGFMGSHLADAYLQKGYDVRGVDNLIGGYADNVPAGVDFHKKDLNDLDGLSKVFSGVDLVVHTACTAYEGLSVFSPALISRNTYQITANVVSQCLQNDVSKIVNMSSMARYGTQACTPFTEDMVPAPQDPYGIAKYASELLIKNLSETHGFSFVNVVPHNIIGPRQKYDDPFRNVASIMVNRMLQGKQPIIYGDGNQKRCFSFISDVTNPLVKASEMSTVNGLTINIGPDEEFISINELAEKLASILSFDLNPIYLPGRPQEVINANCSAGLAREMLSYRTTTKLIDGLQQLVEWIIEKGPKSFDYHLPIEYFSDRTPKSWTLDWLNK